MSDSEEDVVLKDDDGFGEQVDLDDFSFISTEAPSNEKGSIYDQSDNEDDKKQATPSKSQDGNYGSPEGKKMRQKRERSPSPQSHRQTPSKDRHRRIHSSDSDSDEQNEITQNNRPPPPMVTPATEVHVDLDEIKSLQGNKAGFAEFVLKSVPDTATYAYNTSIDPSSFNPAHSGVNPNSREARYKDFSTKKAPRSDQGQWSSNNTPVRHHSQGMQGMRNQSQGQQYSTSQTQQYPSSQGQQYPSQPYSQQQPQQNYNQPLPHVQGAPPIPGVALTQQQFDELYRYKVNTNNNNNNTKPRDNKQIREPTLQTTNPLAPKVPDEIILEEKKRVELKLEVSKIVVKTLTKYLKEGKIANKDDFKHLSRKLTHKIMLKEQGIKNTISEKRTKSIQKFIDNWFRKKGGSYVRKSKPWEKPPSVVNFVPPLHPGM